MAGLTSKEFGACMSISRRTVEAHLEHVREQLGFQDCAQVAAWAANRGLAVGEEV